MVWPKTSYLVCASQRSGTELLCRGLSDTGVAGRPQEYLLAEDPARLPDRRFWEEGPLSVEHGVTDREAYLALVYALGTCEVRGAAEIRRPRSCSDPARGVPRFACRQRYTSRPGAPGSLLGADGPRRCLGAARR
ncbi:MAG TPA: Stf0 family sulfotransferase [Mycobacteriales bacterium]|nr:Stf0 family sulfotransferase [Mycobacteriales bacterium]